MKIRAFVPLVTYTDANSDAIAANAALVARHLGAELHALSLNVTIQPVSNALSRLLIDVREMVQETEAQSRLRGQHLLAEIVKQAQEAGISATTAEVAVPPALLAETAAGRARYFDLSLLGWEASSATCRTAAEAVVFGSGRPAILLPETSPAKTFDHVAIAWDGSRSAARAVADARPFIERAARVTVLTLTGEKRIGEGAAERLAAALKDSGVQAEAAVLDIGRAGIGEKLQASAVERGCGLLVMGGYGHSRLRDFVLGGATQGVIDRLELPVLLSH